MKKCVLILVAILISWNELFAQRGNISREDGEKGLLIGLAIFFTIIFISIILHLRRKRDES